LSKGFIAIVAVSVFVAFVLCTAAAYVMFKFRVHVSQPTSTPRLSHCSLTKASVTATGSLIGDGGIGSVSSLFESSIAAYTVSAKTFSMNDVEKATDNFHASRILGEGGFGLVYSGVLGDGTKVAVKVLKRREDHQGDREFLAEVEMLSRLHHRNLVKLIGICA
ncbi:receptor-like serine/threonine-protein kinase ALE2-like, partial [Trifolium medium]|nr:receptor-like serine/threonine-protein kinase ALE2-like [Trifolium medium]